MCLLVSVCVCICVLIAGGYFSFLSKCFGFISNSNFVDSSQNEERERENEQTKDSRYVVLKYRFG